MVLTAITQRANLTAWAIYSKSSQLLYQNGKQCNKSLITRKLSSCCSPDSLMDVNKYEKLSDETLELLCQQFEEMIETQTKLDDSDVELSNGVLTVKLAGNGTYVINKQTPNRQIWLSSPFSGPKRYDWMTNSWIYKRDQTSLQQLLSQEVSKYINNSVNFDLDSLKQLV